MLYVITDGLHFKFGLSKIVNYRLATMQTGNSRKLSVVTAVTEEWHAAYAPWFEQAIHAYLWEDRVMGEWFKGDAPRVRAVVELLKGGYPYDVMGLVYHEIQAMRIRGLIPTEGEIMCPGSRPLEEMDRYVALKKTGTSLDLQSFA